MWLRLLALVLCLICLLPAKLLTRSRGLDMLHGNLSTGADKLFPLTSFLQKSILSVGWSFIQHLILLHGIVLGAVASFSTIFDFTVISVEDGFHSSLDAFFSFFPSEDQIVQSPRNCLVQTAQRAYHPNSAF